MLRVTVRIKIFTIVQTYVQNCTRNIIAYYIMYINKRKYIITLAKFGSDYPDSSKMNNQLTRTNSD